MNAPHHNLLFLVPDPKFSFPPWTNPVFFLFVACEIAVGIVVLVALGRLCRPQLQRIVRGSTIAGGVTWLLGYVLTVWVLLVDPARAHGDIPLPQPAAALLGLDLGILMFGGGILLVLALAHGFLTSKKGRHLGSLVVFSLALYCFLTISWMAGYVLD